MNGLRTLIGWCRQNPTDAIASAAFVALLAGVALLSVPWALITGGGIVFAALATARILGWDQQPPEKPK